MDTGYTLGRIKRVPKSKDREIEERQAQFAKFVEELKQKGIRGEEYREKIMRWNREHKNK